MMTNTVGTAMQTLNDIDRLTEKLDLTRSGDVLPGEDIIKLLCILDQVRESIINSPAYFSVNTCEESGAG